jgi:hypothetical protein
MYAPEGRIQAKKPRRVMESRRGGSDESSESY